MGLLWQETLFLKGSFIPLHCDASCVMTQCSLVAKYQLLQQRDLSLMSPRFSSINIVTEFLGAHETIIKLKVRLYRIRHKYTYGLQWVRRRINSDCHQGNGLVDRCIKRHHSE
jgi:hypothetical protein